MFHVQCKILDGLFSVGWYHKSNDITFAMQYQRPGLMILELLQFLQSFIYLIYDITGLMLH